MDHSISATRPDIVVVKKKKKRKKKRKEKQKTKENLSSSVHCVPTDYRVKLKENEKR